MSKATTDKSHGNPRLLANGTTWQYRVTIAGQQRSFSGATEKEAKRKGEDALRAPAPADLDATTVTDWLGSWLDDQRSRVKPATYRRYRGIATTHLIPALGPIELGRLTTADVTRMESRMIVSSTTVRHAHVVLGTALQAAVAQGRMAANPVRSIRPPRAMHRDKVILSREDAARLLDTAKGDALEAVWVLALTTGMREGEILALRWRDVDLVAGTVTVAGTVVRGLDGDLMVATPKTKSARRTLKVSGRALSVLAAMPHGKPGEFLFTTATGLITPDVLLKQYFRPLLRRAGLPLMPFHDLRHSCATHLLEAGVPLLAVSHLLGHANPAVTMTIYGHLSPRMTEAATAAMDALYPTG